MFSIFVQKQSTYERGREMLMEGKEFVAEKAQKAGQVVKGHKHDGTGQY
jgi:hypothetical protein